MNDDWLEDTTDVLHCSMPPQVRAHIEELRDEVGRLRAAEVPLSRASGFVYIYDGSIYGDGSIDAPFATPELALAAAAEATADLPNGEGWTFPATAHALIPVTAWDRT